MVVWEMALGTAYFLGLRRSYRLAMKMQRRLISPKHPKIRQFAHRRTRAVFDMALKVHQNIQERDIQAGRNLGNWILRWLDKMKPSAHILKEKPPSAANASRSTTKQLTNSSPQKTPWGFQTFKGRIRDQDSGRNMFTLSRNLWRKPFPTIAMMLRQPKPAGTNIQNRHLCISGPEAFQLNHGRLGFEGVIRKDIMQWMLQESTA